MRKVSAATLDLIGYVKGRFNYSMNPDELIEIRVPSEIPGEFDPVSVKAQAFSLSTYYRMDSVLSRGEAFRWPVRDVLWREKIQAKHIGVSGSYAYQGNSPDDNYTVHVPLLVNSQIPGNNDRISRLYLRSTQDIDYLSSEWHCPSLGTKTTETEEVFRSSKPIVLFPPEGLTGFCFVRFLGVIKKRDAGGEGNYVRLELYVYLSE